MTDVIAMGDLKETDLIRLVASAERSSEHPLGQAILEGAAEREIQLVEPGDFQSITGKGIQVTVEGRQVLVGNRRLLADAGIETEEMERRAEELAGQGKTPMFVAVDGQPGGVVAVSDTVKEDSAAAVATLQGLDLEVVMMTGDNPRTAEAIARQVGISRVLAEILPQDKALEVKRLQGEGKIVGMVGDGINDAPALAQADVGIAIGTGTDVAIESSDITLISIELLGVVTAITLSRSTMRNIRENLVFAFGYNIVGIPIAAGLLYPFFGITLSPMIAAAAMALSSLSVTTNANRLRTYQRPALAAAGASGSENQTIIDVERYEPEKEEDMATVKDVVPDSPDQTDFPEHGTLGDKSNYKVVPRTRHCPLTHSNSPLSWGNHCTAKRKIPKRLVFAQVSPLGSPFALYDPITLSSMPSLPEWTSQEPA